MKKKLSLNTLKIDSFITSLDINIIATIKGAGYSRAYGTCAINCDIKEQTTCDRSRVAGSCVSSCGGINTTNDNQTVGIGVGIATNPTG